MIGLMELVDKILTDRRPVFYSIRFVSPIEGVCVTGALVDAQITPTSTSLERSKPYLTGEESKAIASTLSDSLREGVCLKGEK